MLCICLVIEKICAIELTRKLASLAIIINTDLQHMHVYMLMSIGVCDIRCVMC